MGDAATPAVLAPVDVFFELTKWIVVHKKDMTAEEFADVETFYSKLNNVRRRMAGEIDDLIGDDDDE